MDKKRVLKQFEWFEVQTKVRQVIGEVLGPLQKKIMANLTAIGRLETRAGEEAAKVEYLSKMVNQDPDIFQHGIFRNIEGKFKDSQLQIQQLSSKIDYLEQFIGTKTELMDKQLKESSETLGGLSDFKEYMKGEINNQSDKMVKGISNIFQNFDNLNEDIAKITVSLESFKRAQDGYGTRISAIEQRVKEAGEELKADLDGFQEKISSIKLTQDMSLKDLSHVNEEILRVEHFQKYTKRLEQHISDLSIEIDNLEYKVEVINPMVSLAQINQYAHHFLHPHLHNNISIHFYNKYKSMAQQIINNEIDRTKVGKAKRDNLGVISDVHKRATKTVYRLKKLHLAEQGIEIDSLTHDKREDLLQNLHLQETFGDVDTMFGDQVVKKKQVEEDSVAKEMQKEKDLWLAELKEKIAIQLKDSKEYILSMEDLIKRDLQSMEKSVSVCLKSCEQLQMNTQLQQKYGRELQNSCRRSIGDMQTEISKLEGYLKVNHSVIAAYHQIEKQDEIDRNNIALIGVKEQHRDPVREHREQLIHKKPVDIDKGCLSCSGNPNYYNQFFKMACLTYTSSPVKFNNQMYERVELLEKIKKDIEEVGKGLARKENQIVSKSSQEIHPVRKVDRYESSQIFRVASRETKSASDSFAVRNLTSSQDIVRNHDKGQEDRQAQRETPRIINSKELADQYMSKNRSRIYNKRREVSWREQRNRKEGGSKDRMEYMIRVSSFFKDLKRQNQDFISDGK